MIDSLELAAGATNFGAAAVYLYVGYRLFLRPVPASARLASIQFTVWWCGIGVSAALAGTEAILAELGSLTFPLALTFSLLALQVACAFLWGLVGYLLYIYTGRNLVIPLSVFYAAFYAISVYFILAQSPYGVVVQSGVPTLQYGASANPALLSLIISGLLVPELGGAVLYLSLLRRTKDRTQRYRILLVGTSILLWFGIALALPSTTTYWTLLKGLLESVAALLSLVGLLPPAWIRARLGVSAIEGPESVDRGVLPDS